MPLCGATVNVILEGEFKEMSGAYIDYQHLGFRKLEEFFRQGIPDVVKLEVTSTGDTVSCFLSFHSVFIFPSDVQSDHLRRDGSHFPNGAKAKAECPKTHLVDEWIEPANWNARRLVQIRLSQNGPRQTV